MVIPMSNVEFSDEKAYTASLERRGTPPKKGLGSLPIRLGLAKDETGAIIVLIVVAILVFAVAGFIFIRAY